jgi:NTE family protein
VGTSAGALNATYVAGHGTSLNALEGLAARWIATRRSAVFPIDPVRHVMALSGARPSLFADHGLRRLVAQQLVFARLEDASIEVHIIATDLASGREAVLSHGDALSAVLASTAIPGVLPAVDRDGLTLIDGALANNAAESVAVGLGAERVFVLPTGYACALARPPSGALGVALQSLTFLIQQRLITDVAYYAERVDLNVLPALCPLTVPPTNFGQAGKLIDRAYLASSRWIDEGGLDLPRAEQYLSLHRHSRGSVSAPDGGPDTAGPAGQTSAHRHRIRHGAGRQEGAGEAEPGGEDGSPSVGDGMPRRASA